MNVKLVKLDEEIRVLILGNKKYNFFMISGLIGTLKYKSKSENIKIMKSSVISYSLSTVDLRISCNSPGEIKELGKILERRLEIEKNS